MPDRNQKGKQDMTKILVKIELEHLTEFAKLPVKRDKLVDLHLQNLDFIDYDTIISKNYRHVASTGMILSDTALSILDNLAEQYHVHRNDMLNIIIRDLLLLLTDVPLTKLIKLD